MINQAILLGRVGKKDSKTLKNGSNVTYLSIATSKRFKDSAGINQEQSMWHNINCYNKLAEIAAKYVHVGDLIHIMGEIQHKKIESGERSGQYTYSVNAHDIKFIPSGKKSENTGLPQNEEAFDDAIPF
jgi:single-strand DNA-binding protein